MSAEIAVIVLWLVWYATWIAAVVWSSQTKTQMRTDMFGLHRILFSFGLVLLLFLPTTSLSPSPAAGSIAWWTQKLWQDPDWAAWSLFALVVAGFAFCWWARFHLGRLWSGYVTLKENHRVVDTGPYGLVRHPIYTGIIFAGAMTALLRASPAALVGAVLVLVGLSMTARIEERFLRAQLGADAYDAYSKRVAMLVPKVL